LTSLTDRTDIQGFYDLIPYRFFAILAGLEKNEIHPKEMISKTKGLFFY